MIGAPRAHCLPTSASQAGSPSAQPQQSLVTITCVNLFSLAVSVREGGDSISPFSLRAYCVPGIIVEATGISGDLEAGAGERKGGPGPGFNRRVIVMEEVAASY